MRDLTRPAWMYAKAALLVFAGLLASALLLAEHPALKTAFLLAVAVWCFCRAYYFAFYVVGSYIDPAFRFAGLLALTRYLFLKRRATKADGETSQVSPP